MKEQLFEIGRFIKNFLFSIVNREFLIFLFFLIVSGTFWLLMALNETVEREFEVPVSLVGVPKDVVITTDIQDTLKVTLRDKGFTLAAYMYSDRLQPMKVIFRNYTAKDNGRGQVALSEIQRYISQQLYGSTKITSVKPDRLEFFYNHGISKRVPVRFIGRVIPAENYYLSRTLCQPSQVTVYADKALLDSISFVGTEALRLTDFADTVVRKVPLQTIRGAKVVPAEVEVTFCPDILTEEAVEVPIVAVGMPEGKVLRTFPAKTSVSFVAGVSVYRNLKPEDFTIIADYQELRKNPSEKCRIYLKKVPNGISRAKLETNMVDYLIESQEQDQGQDQEQKQ